MKTKLFLFGLLCLNLSFGQTSLTLGPIPQFSTTGPNAPVATEIFRFRPGLVTQIQDGVGFGFGATNRWFSLGSITQGSQTFYGSRFQTPGNALVMGFTSASPNNPRIQWIGSGATLGNLEFRVADSFTTAVSALVATMKPDGSTVFGDPALFVDSQSEIKVEVVNFAPSLFNAIGISSSATLAENSAIGIKGKASGLVFAAAIYGDSPITPTTTASNRWAGYFDGKVYGSTFIKPSDERLKSNIQPDKGFLEKIATLRAVTYAYNKMGELNLPEGIQHGFIAQELEKVFPEMITEVNKPVFDNDGKIKSQFQYKAVDYMGLISVLTGGIQELNSKVIALEKQLAERDPKSDRKSISPAENSKGAYMQQNIPNPFGDQTTISYQLPEETTSAEIMVFDLNGRLIKNYPISKNQSEITIKASEIGSGLFIYSLVQNGQELMSKKMIVK